MATLDEVKKFAEEFLRTQQEMLKMISSLPVNEVNEFNEWYTSNQYYIDLQNLSNSVRK